MIPLVLIQAGFSALAEGFRFLSTDQGQKVVERALADTAEAKRALQVLADRFDGWAQKIGQ